MENKREIGTYYETLAAEYLQKQGITVIEKNFRCSRGEIDLITKDGRYLVFTEVKFRTCSAKWIPEEAVDYKKQKKICRVAEFYCYRNRIPEDLFMRFDVIAICSGEEIRWHKNAFSYRKG